MKNRVKPYQKHQRVDGIIVEGQMDLPQRRCSGHCREKFQPSHRYNFVCPKCAVVNEQIDGREYKVARKFPHD